VKVVYFFILVTWGALIGCRGSLESAAQGSACIGDSATIQCLVQNFDALYQGDYAQFWAITHKSEKALVGCKSTNKVTGFLAVAAAKGGNAEFNEYFAEVVEQKLVLAHPQCFLDALLGVDPSTTSIILSDLKHPLSASQRDIAVTLERFRAQERYRKLLAPYFSSE